MFKERIEELKSINVEVENQLKSLNASDKARIPLIEDLKIVNEELNIIEFNYKLIIDVFNSLDKNKYPKSIESWNHGSAHDAVLKDLYNKYSQGKKVATYAINHLRDEIEHPNAFFSITRFYITKDIILAYCDDIEKHYEHDN